MIPSGWKRARYATVNAARPNASTADSRKVWMPDELTMRPPIALDEALVGPFRRNSRVPDVSDFFRSEAVMSSPSPYSRSEITKR